MKNSVGIMAQVFRAFRQIYDRVGIAYRSISGGGDHADIDHKIVVLIYSYTPQMSAGENMVKLLSVV
jgi:hypothetical protein